GPHAPDREADDEEVVALADLTALARRGVDRIRITVPEVQVEDETHGKDGEERREVRPARAVPPVVRPRAEQPQPGEDHGEQRPHAAEERLESGHGAGPLPVEILEVVAELRREQADVP